MITGIISLLDSFGTPTRIKRYKGKDQRNEIIKDWKDFYALNKNKLYYVSIIPYLEENKATCSGYICISSDSDYSDTNYERRFYRSYDDRNNIIAEFVEQKKMEKYFLEITPNV